MLNTTFINFNYGRTFGLGATRKRSRSSGFGGGGGKALDTIILIGGLGALGVAGYFVLKSGKGAEEILDSGGDALKSLVDAGNSTGDWIADGSYWLQKQLGIGAPAGRGEESDIVRSIKREVGDTKRDQDVTKKKYIDTWKPWADAVDSTFDAFKGIGCGVIRKC